ncbi:MULTISPECIES: DUF1819 family protein [Psychrobacter]|uniref:DUF1819 family protein n=1 Tax=Psychrobacter TaxID=497 RepID=UPI00178880D1|nr:DUF1819 family protein [Psychrobacter sp. FME5]MBE0445593.1 DUF1819 family protein [Psychrobacter sp. FME5]
MNTRKYKMSFTAATVLPRESVVIADEYLKLSDWHLVKKKVVDENLLQAKAESSLKRISQELIGRLKMLSLEETEWLVRTNRQEQIYILWLAICRRYKFIAEFAIEVLRERFITLKVDLTHEDFDVFFNHKCDWYSELDNLSESTKYKLRQVLFKMMREVGFLNTDNIIQGVMLSTTFLDHIKKNNTDEIKYFPSY